jgi:hypothetical protein
MKCPKCGTEMLENGLPAYPVRIQMRCPQCGHKQDSADDRLWLGASVSNGKTPGERDADLLDGFAKAALQGMLACPDTVGTYEALVREAFVYADVCMSERARRREAGK